MCGLFDTLVLKNYIEYFVLTDRVLGGYLAGVMAAYVFRFDWQGIRWLFSGCDGCVCIARVNDRNWFIRRSSRLSDSHSNSFSARFCTSRKLAD